MLLQRLVGPLIWRTDLPKVRVAKASRLLEAVMNTAVVEGPPKSAAGRRDVAIPDVILADLRAHLERWSQPGADGRVFGYSSAPTAASLAGRTSRRPGATPSRRPA
jgi:hypothetical protein